MATRGAWPQGRSSPESHSCLCRCRVSMFPQRGVNRVNGVNSVNGVNGVNTVRISASNQSLFSGEPQKLDPSFRGPVLQRNCTDVFCCFLFLFIITAYAALGIVACYHGNLHQLLHPTDSSGHVCGLQGSSTANKPVLFYFNVLRCSGPAVVLAQNCPTTQMCVSHCPETLSTFSQAQLQHQEDQRIWDYFKQFCRPDFDPDHILIQPVSEVLRDEQCPSIIVPSKPFLHRCIPDFQSLNGSAPGGNRTSFTDALEGSPSITELQQAARGIKELLDTKEMALKMMEDLVQSWFWIFMSLVLASALSLVFLLVLRSMVAVLLGSTVLLLLLLLTYGLWFCSSRWFQLRDSQLVLTHVGFQTDPKVLLQLRETWMLFMCTLAVTESSVLLMLIWFRSKVHVAITLLTEASRAVGLIWSTLFLPLLTFLLMTAAAIYWAMTAILLLASGEAVFRVVSPDPRCPHGNSSCRPEDFSRTNISTSGSCLGSRCQFAFYGGETFLQRHLLLLQVSNLLVFLWLINFTLALQQCTLAGVFATYYWARRKPQDLPSFPVFSSLSRTLRYHTGSLAFGALVLSVVQLLRILLEYMQKTLKGLDSSVSRFLTCCLRCCFWSLERFIRYLNHHAYIMMAIYGDNLCSSAREAFTLLLRNLLRVAVVDRVTDFLLFLGKVLISGGVGLCAFFLLTEKIPAIQEDLPDLNYPWVPVLVVVGGAFLAAHASFSVYVTCVETLLLCFCDDLERNDGTSEKPFHASPELRRILGKCPVLLR